MCSTSILQIHADSIQKVSTKVTSGYFLKETEDFFHNVASMCPAGTLWKNPGVSFIVWLTMCPACNLSHSLRILSQCDWCTLRKCSQFTQQSKWNQSGEQILNQLSICPLGKMQVNCLKSLKKPSICLPGKTPSAPSVCPQVLFFGPHNS